MSEKYKNKYRIESNRWKLWDYSAPASYFITICIIDRKYLLGNIKNNKMILSEYGKIVSSEIQKIPEYNKRIKLDAWVVMPNHIHLIIRLGAYDFNNGVGMDNDMAMVEKIHEFSLPKEPGNNNTINQLVVEDLKKYRKLRRNMLIPKILGKLQQQTSKKINILRNTVGVKNWQSDYYDHIIRTNKSYETIKNYIINNPSKWNKDRFNNNKKT